MKRNLQLLVIDPQNDFCDLPPAYLPSAAQGGASVVPALPVPGAHDDMLRVAGLIRTGAAGLTGISITMDAHHRYDIAHPTFWMTAQGGDVAPFTSISAAAVRAAEFQPRQPTALPRALAYLDALEAEGRYQLMIWPVHCEIGTWGQNVHADVRAAYNAWEEKTLSVVSKISKGSNPWTEHYSAIRAEVPDAGDPDTQLNQSLILELSKADRVYICGEAGSHCVKATTEHLVENFAAADLHKLVLLTDCMSAVSGFDAQFEGFVRDMVAKGVQIAKMADVLPELLANAAA
ncbi:cysteine hydrolase [Undibacterium sp. CY18W]|uniref:Cysteine hydrolase n=1 Tax=Undibacterium hunanense TaxID=2762292 RepID=A0ABR6ZNH5_9BURK|nr:cysteine hydrolase [Undibacterium hunanense]MBC3916995.1 cysteine hydrolase [Undibacterium hunanense]